MRIAVTGATAGIGLAATKKLVARGDEVIMACRNLAKAEEKRREIASELGLSEDEAGKRMTLVALDVSSIASARTAAEKMKELGVEKLYHNAGSMFAEWALTDDGVEKSLATNCVGVAALTEALQSCESLKTIVFTVSISCKVAAIDKTCFSTEQQKDYSRLGNYSRSKLALFLYISKKCELNQSKIRYAAIDPGIVNTNMITQERWFDPLANIFFRPFIRKPETAADIGIRALDDSEPNKLYRGKKTYEFPKFVQNHPLRDWIYEEITKRVGQG